MIQVSLIGYMSAGSFLGLQYFDLFYHLIVIVVAVRAFVEREIAMLPHVVAASPQGRMRRAGGPAQRRGTVPPA